MVLYTKPVLVRHLFLFYIQPQQVRPYTTQQYPGLCRLGCLTIEGNIASPPEVLYTAFYT